MQAILWILALAGAPAHADDVDAWLAQERTASVQLMLENVAPQGCAAGSVVASPSRNNPDYFFHWVRDASLVMERVVALLEVAATPAERQSLFNTVAKYAAFSRKLQLTPNASGAADDLGLGEPHFNCDGTPFNQPWGRPQNDGPALRAIALIRLASDLIKSGQTVWVKQNLWPVIQPDLVFVARHWRDPSYDIWEEVKGDHFYTRMVQRKALLEGASLANAIGDTEGPVFQQQARVLEPEIQKHWDASRGFVVATLDQVNGIPGKSGLDSAVILGSLHGCADDGFFCPGDPKIMATALKLEQTFQALYPIARVQQNSTGDLMGVPIGRYPEDTYAGSNPRSIGNPWFLLTNAFAELYFRANQADKARTFLRRVRFHSAAGSARFSEQYSRETGQMMSAPSLTWNYASFLTIPD